MSEQLDLEAIKARAEAATEGPWQVDKPPYALGAYTGGGGDCTVTVSTKLKWSSKCGDEPERAGVFKKLLVSWQSKQDAEFIAHARTDIPALIAEIERLRALVRLATVSWEDVQAQAGCAPPLSPQAHSHIQRQLEAQTGSGEEVVE
jgi:hypothetical protein